MRRPAAAAALACFFALMSFPHSPVRAEPSAVAADLPLVDFHEHLLPQRSAEDPILLMEEAGIRRMVLMPVGVGSNLATDEQALAYARQFPGRFIPFVRLMSPVIQGRRGQRERWLHPDGPALDFLRQVEDKLKTGRFYGMGELIARHYGYTNTDGGEVPEFDNSVDSPLVHKLAELAERYHVVIDIHAEGEPALVEAMGRVLAAHPGATIVWAHNCGRSSASTLREVLQRYPNLLCDLGGMAGTFGYVNGKDRVPSPGRPSSRTARGTCFPR